MVIAIFFVGHWLSSVFSQTFFLHRYCAHRMFSMTKGWERFFHILTWISQGSSYLDPRGYAILHREHHAFSDTKRDPHAPGFFSNPLTMMWATKDRYVAYARRTQAPEPRFDGGVPTWTTFEKFAQSNVVRGLWIVFYIAVYSAFATEAWQWILLPIHFVMGPVHGAIVNWCGHKYGYQNFDNGDRSKNVLPLDFVTLGELFQNNHHRFAMSPNFAGRWFELDPTYQVMRALAALGVIDLGSKPQTIRHTAAARAIDLGS